MWLGLIELVIIFILIVVILYMRKRIRELEFSVMSKSVKHGKMIEEFAPFINKYPYDPEKFRFIGSPIDGVQFEDDKIVFIEFKTSDSKLTKSQRRIKDIVKNKKIYFEEFRIK